MAWLQQNMTMILAILLGLSESLALAPAVKANSIFQLLFNFLKSINNPPKP